MTMRHIHSEPGLKEDSQDLKDVDVNDTGFKPQDIETVIVKQECILENLMKSNDIHDKNAIVVKQEINNDAYEPELIIPFENTVPTLSINLDDVKGIKSECIRDKFDNASIITSEELNSNTSGKNNDVYKNLTSSSQDVNNAFNDKSSTDFMVTPNVEDVLINITTNNVIQSVLNESCNDGGIVQRSGSEQFESDVEHKHTCPACFKTYINDSRLKSHMLTHTNERPFKCPFCSKGFKSKSILKKHLKVHSGLKEFELDISGNSGEQCYKCNVCDKEYASSDSLKQHMLIHTDVKVLECDICSKKFTRSTSLKEHMMVHNGDRNYPCEYCDKRCITKYRLKIHMLAHTDERPYPCTFCDKGFIGQGHLNKHMKTHGVKEFECNICPRQFFFKSDRNKHLLTHKKERPYKCEVCHKSYASDVILKQHMMIHIGVKLVDKHEEDAAVKQECIPENDGLIDSEENITVVKHEIINDSFETVLIVPPENKILNVSIKSETIKDATTSEHLESINSKDAENKYKCQLCSKAFCLNSRLKAHMLSHTEERPFKCTFCNKGFKNINNVAQHLRVHSGIKEFKCDICDRQFYWKTSLKQHMTMHSNARPYKCDVCDEEYVTHDNLQQHMLIHSGMQLFECDVCSKKFTSRTAIMKHTKKHIAEQKYICQYCPKRCQNSNALKVHIRSHTGDKPYECETCDRKFQQKKHLIIHQRKHTGERPFPCTICDRPFISKQNLKQHIQTHTKQTQVMAKVTTRE